MTPTATANANATGHHQTTPAASATATSPATSDAAATAAVLQLQYGPLSADFLEKHARVERRVTGQQAYMEQEKALAQAAGGPSRTRNVH